MFVCILIHKIVHATQGNPFIGHTTLGSDLSGLVGPLELSRA